MQFERKLRILSHIPKFQCIFVALDVRKPIFMPFHFTLSGMGVWVVTLNVRVGRAGEYAYAKGKGAGHEGVR